MAAKPSIRAHGRRVHSGARSMAAVRSRAPRRRDSVSILVPLPRCRGGESGAAQCSLVLGGGDVEQGIELVMGSRAFLFRHHVMNY